MGTWQNIDKKEKKPLWQSIMYWIIATGVVVLFFIVEPSIALAITSLGIRLEIALGAVIALPGFVLFALSIWRPHLLLSGFKAFKVPAKDRTAGRTRGLLLGGAAILSGCIFAVTGEIPLTLIPFLVMVIISPFILVLKSRSEDISDSKNMNDEIIEALNRLKEKYPITVKPSEKEVVFKVEGVDETFQVDDSHGEYTLFTNTWHEHFENSTVLEKFIDGLFSGNIRIKVKFRGEKPLSHKVGVFRDGHIEVVSLTSSFAFPFWRKKTYKELDYRVTSAREKPL